MKICYCECPHTYTGEDGRKYCADCNNLKSSLDQVNDEVFDYGNPNDGFSKELLETITDVLSKRSPKSKNKFQLMVFGTPEQCEEAMRKWNAAMVRVINQKEID